MILNCVKIQYEVKWLPSKRHRKELVWRTYEEIDVEVRELSEDEFPLAFLVTETQSVYEGAKTEDDFKKDTTYRYRPLAEEIRMYNDALYKAVRITHGAAVSTEFETANKIAKRFSDEIWLCGAKPDDMETDKAIILSSSKDTKIKEKEEIIEKRLVYFDNKFWLTCPEPGYKYNTFGLGHNHGGTGFFTQYFSDVEDVADSVYNALDFEKAIEDTVRVALNRGDTESAESIRKKKATISVFMPEAVKIRSRAELNALKAKEKAFKEKQVDITLSIGEIELIIENLGGYYEKDLREKLLNVIANSKEDADV